jgi:hypothetical protein
MYCGGSYRTGLTCDAAQKLGYRRVFFRSSVATGSWPMVK